MIAFHGGTLIFKLPVAFFPITALFGSQDNLDK